jgi:hypothetical protein
MNFNSESGEPKKREAYLWAIRATIVICSSIFLFAIIFLMLNIPGALSNHMFWIFLFVGIALSWWMFEDDTEGIMNLQRELQKKSLLIRRISVSLFLILIFVLIAVDRTFTSAVGLCAGGFLAMIAQGIRVYGLNCRKSFCQQCSFSRLFFRMEGHWYCAHCGAEIVDNRLG